MTETRCVFSNFGQHDVDDYIDVDEFDEDEIEDEDDDKDGMVLCEIDEDDIERIPTSIYSEHLNEGFIMIVINPVSKKYKLYITNNFENVKRTNFIIFIKIHFYNEICKLLVNIYNLMCKYGNNDSCTYESLFYLTSNEIYTSDIKDNNYIKQYILPVLNIVDSIQFYIKEEDNNVIICLKKYEKKERVISEYTLIYETRIISYSSFKLSKINLLLKKYLKTKDNNFYSRFCIKDVEILNNITKFGEILF